MNYKWIWRNRIHRSSYTTIILFHGIEVLIDVHTVLEKCKALKLKLVQLFYIFFLAVNLLLPYMIFRSSSLFCMSFLSIFAHWSMIKQKKLKEVYHSNVLQFTTLFIFVYFYVIWFIRHGNFSRLSHFSC